MEISYDAEKRDWTLRERDWILTMQCRFLPERRSRSRMIDGSMASSAFRRWGG